MTGFYNEKRWVKLSLALIIALFTIINVYSVLRYNDYFLLGSIEKADNDDVKYIGSAWTLLEKGMLTYHDVNVPTVYIMPGHTIIIAAITGIFGKYGGITAFRLFQVLLQALSILLVFLIGRTVFNSSVGIIAAFINATYVSEIFVTGTILTEVEFKFLLLLLVYISINAIKTKKTRYYIEGGIVWGIACLFRPTIALYPVAILAAWLIYKYSFKEIFKFSIIVLVIFAAIMSPWWIRNYIVFNRFIPLTLSSGNPFLQGTYINYDQSKDYTPYTPSKDVIETNEIEMKTGIYRLKTYFVKYPLKYIYWYTFGKSWYLWNYPFYWKEIFGISVTMATVHHHLILIAGIPGIISIFGNKSLEGIFLITVILYFSLSYLPFYTFSRYSYPMMPLVMLFSSYAVFKLYKGISAMCRTVP
ncbi:MAG TPA: glycosyltransferase family 39 protein [Clostridiales bacterium]|nr:glycosyltransferase family 39 protein [Clostridiales bacterium]